MDYDSSYKKKTTGPYKESKARNIAMQRLVNNKIDKASEFKKRLQDMNINEQNKALKVMNDKIFDENLDLTIKNLNLEQRLSDIADTVAAKNKDVPVEKRIADLLSQKADLQEKIQALQKENETLKEKIQSYAQEVSKKKLEIVYDDPKAEIWNKKYDYTWWATTFNRLKKYANIFNWLLIGSVGSPHKLEAQQMIAKRMVNIANQSLNRGEDQWLANVLVELYHVQKMLYQRPSGYDYFQSWTHRLQDFLMCTSQGAIKRSHILEAIKEAAKRAQRSPGGVKLICLYYTGHGKFEQGDWCFKDGYITLQDIMDQFDPKDNIRLLILSDCCYSGKWAKRLIKEEYLVKGNISLTYYSSCDEDELAEEGVLTKLLEGHVPDLAGGGDFSVLRDSKDQMVQEQIIRSWSGDLPKVDSEGKRIATKYSHLSNYGIIKEYLGGQYEGQIVDGLPHGEGKKTKPGGGVSARTWYKGEMQSNRIANVNNLPPGFELTGEQVDGKPVVRGKEDYSGGSFYDGEWVDGFRHGHGKYTFVNGAVYEGDYKYGKRDGHCRYTWPRGAVYEGSYKDDKRHGHGKYTWPNKAVFEGPYVQGKKHGVGTYTQTNGYVEQQTWVHGVEDKTKRKRLK